jgi:hypothetical protein
MIFNVLQSLAGTEFNSVEAFRKRRNHLKE